jgi:hypothetical protein
MPPYSHETQRIIMDMRRIVHELRDVLDDLAESMERETENDVEAVVSITSNGAGLLRTRAFFDNVKVQFNAAGQGRIKTPRGPHQLTWDVQGPRNALVRIEVIVDGMDVAAEAGDLGEGGRDGGTIKFTID